MSKLFCKIMNKPYIGLFIGLPDKLSSYLIALNHICSRKSTQQKNLLLSRKSFLFSKMLVFLRLHEFQSVDVDLLNALLIQPFQ